MTPRAHRVTNNSSLELVYNLVSSKCPLLQYVSGTTILLGDGVVVVAVVVEDAFGRRRRLPGVRVEDDTFVGDVGGGSCCCRDWSSTTVSGLTSSLLVCNCSKSNRAFDNRVDSREVTSPLTGDDCCCCCFSCCGRVDAYRVTADDDDDDADDD